MSMPSSVRVALQYLAARGSIEEDFYARARIVEAAAGRPKWSISGRGKLMAFFREGQMQFPKVHADWFSSRDQGVSTALGNGVKKVLGGENRSGLVPGYGRLTYEEVIQNITAGFSPDGKDNLDKFGSLGKRKGTGIMNGRIKPKDVLTTLFGYGKDAGIDVTRTRNTVQRQRGPGALVNEGQVSPEGYVSEAESHIDLDRTPGDQFLSLLSTPKGSEFKNWLYRKVRTKGTKEQKATLEVWIENPEASNAKLGKAIAKYLTDSKTGEPKTMTGQMIGKHKANIGKLIRQEVKRDPKVLGWMDEYLDRAQLGYGGGSFRAAKKMAARVAHMFLNASDIIVEVTAVTSSTVTLKGTGHAALRAGITVPKKWVPGSPTRGDEYWASPTRNRKQPWTFKELTFDMFG